MVDLLSHHLYSSPRVYLRELLQNAVDAITARAEEEPDAPRRVRVVPADVSPDGCLHVEDTGIGLDEDGIRGVLATIGASTKRDALGLARESFLGQFGIGLLSCFLVTDEIRVTTRRAGSDETWLWVGRDDGTYAVSPAPSHAPSPGTDVAIRPRGSAADLLSADVVERLATSFAAHLRLDLVVETAAGPVSVAGRAFPWEDGEGTGRRAAASPLVRGRARLHPARRRRPVRPRGRGAGTGLRAPPLLGCTRHAPALREADAGGRLGARRAARVGLLRAGRARRRRAGADGLARVAARRRGPARDPVRGSASSSSAGC